MELETLLVACATILAITATSLAFAQRTPRRPNLPFLLTSALLTLWWALVLLAARRGLLEATPTSTVPMLLLGWIPLLPLCLLFSSPTKPPSLALLVAAHTSRLLTGLAMLHATLVGLLPALFALPAALGGLLIGATAPWIALHLARSKSSPTGRPSATPDRNAPTDPTSSSSEPPLEPQAILEAAPKWPKLWNRLGLLDILLSMILGGLTNPGPNQLLSKSFPSTASSHLPLVLIPAFLVPLYLFTHLTLHRNRPEPLPQP